MKKSKNSEDRYGMGGKVMMKIVTFNIRCDYNQDGINSFRFRKALIEEKIKEEQADIICFQEVLPHVAAWLKETLDEYYVIGIGRSESYEDEQATIAYKKDVLNLISFNTFWLSPTPTKPGSRYELQSMCPRTCACATFQILSTNRMFRVYNTHLDHESSNARLLGINQIIKQIEDDNNLIKLPIILLGDFNGEPNSPEISELNHKSRMIDLSSDISYSFHNYGREEEKIDYIYASKDIKCNHTEVWSDCLNQVYLSDHYPICVRLEI